MKHLIHFVLAMLCVALLSACTSAPIDPTPKQQVVANAVEDMLSIGLVPVLTKNRTYVPAAAAIAASLGTFSGSTITPADVDAFLAKTKLSSDDAAVVAGLVNAAWDTYSRRYASQVSKSVRPDVKVFLEAVANGINRAIVAVPKSTALHELRRGDQILCADGVNILTYQGDGGWTTTLAYVAPKEPQFIDESRLLNPR